MKLKMPDTLWYIGGAVALVVGVVLISKNAQATRGGLSIRSAGGRGLPPAKPPSSTPNVLGWTYGKSAGQAGQAGTQPSTTSLVTLSDPNHVFTTGEVQFLLNQWGSSPLPPITGQWSDATSMAVRDFQSRGASLGAMNVSGDPFDVGTSRALQALATQLLLQPNRVFSLADAQALMRIPITGQLDAATKAAFARLYIPADLSNPVTQAYLRTQAVTLRQYGGGLF